ncbi:hypothetical protein EGW08_021708, partial [Elysia chlorotica]
MSQISLDDLFRTVNLHQAKAGMADSGTDMGTKSSLFARSVSVSELEADSAGAQDTRHPILKLISSKTVEELEKQHLEEHKRLKGSNLPSAASRLSPAQAREQSPRAGSASAAESGSGGGVSGGGIDLMQFLTQGAKTESVPDKSRVGVSPDSAVAVKRLITSQDPQFGTNRSFIPVPSGAQQLSDIESSHPWSHTEKTPPPSGSTANSTVMGAAALPPPPPSVFALPKEAPVSKESPVVFPVLLKPSDLDPSLAKTAVASPSSFIPSVNSLLTPQAFSDRPLFSEASSASGTDTAPPATGPALSSLDSTPAPLTKEQ